MVLGYFTSPAYHRLKEGHSHYKAAYFEKEGHYLQYIVAGVIKKNLIKKSWLFLFRSITISGSSKMIITKDWSYPVVSLDPQLYPEEFIKSRKISIHVLWRKPEILKRRYCMIGLKPYLESNLSARNKKKSIYFLL